MKTQLELYSLTTFDGQTLMFPTDDATFLEIGGFAMPPVNYITKRGYKQHGETEVGYVLQKRPVKLHLHFNHACSRYQYWQNRALVMDILRQNRAGAMTLTVLLPGDPSTDSGNYSKSGATLASNMALGDVTVTLSSALQFVVGMWIRIDQEYMLITAVNGTTGVLTVSRTGPKATHTSGAAVWYAPLTALSRKRSIVVRPDPGLLLDVDASREANWYIDETIQFVAFNPVWFDPTTQIQSVAAAANQQLVFPITFPIVFGSSGFTFPVNIAYAGSWYSYPVFTLTGPYSSAIITNTTTGVSFIMAVALPGGAQRIITTTPGNISILDASGNNAFSELGPGSNLVDMNIRPTPEAPNGVNAFTINMYAPGSGSAAALSYNAQFLGI